MQAILCRLDVWMGGEGVYVVGIGFELSVCGWSWNVRGVYVEECGGEDAALRDSEFEVSFGGGGVVVGSVGFPSFQVVCREFNDGRWDVCVEDFVV